jgi:hypothetical protein
LHVAAIEDTYALDETGTTFVSASGMNLSLIPSGPWINGEVHSYAVDLPRDRRAELRIVENGWELVISGPSGQVVRRGLFGSPHDALMLLEAENYPRAEGLFLK